MTGSDGKWITSTTDIFDTVLMLRHSSHEFVVEFENVASRCFASALPNYASAHVASAGG